MVGDIHISWSWLLLEDCTALRTQTIICIRQHFADLWQAHIWATNRAIKPNNHHLELTEKKKKMFTILKKYRNNLDVLCVLTTSIQHVTSLKMQYFDRGCCTHRGRLSAHCTQLSTPLKKQLPNIFLFFFFYSVSTKVCS